MGFRACKSHPRAAAPWGVVGRSRWLRNDLIGIASSAEGTIDISMYILRKLRMTKTYSVAEARNSLTSLIDEVQIGKAVEITRRGKPVAILVSIKEYDSLKQRGKRRKGLWEIVLRVRNQPGFEGIDKDDLDLDALRDKSGGREVTWPN